MESLVARFRARLIAKCRCLPEFAIFCLFVANKLTNCAAQPAATSRRRQRQRRQRQRLRRQLQLQLPLHSARFRTEVERQLAYITHTPLLPPPSSREREMELEPMTRCPAIDSEWEGGERGGN